MFDNELQALTEIYEKISDVEADIVAAFQQQQSVCEKMAENQKEILQHLYQIVAILQTKCRCEKTHPGTPDAIPAG